MKLWLDGQCFQSASAWRGIGRYAEGLIEALARNDAIDEIHISFNGNLPDEAASAMQRLKSHIPLEHQHIWFGHEDGGEAIVGQTSHRRLSEFALSHHILTIGPDIAISLSPFEGDTVALTPFLPQPDFPIPSAAIFYDAIPYRLPDLYLVHDGLKRAYERRLAALQNFTKLLAISDYAKAEAEALVPGVPVTSISAGLSDDLVKHFGSDIPDGIETILSGDDISLLYVGGLDRRKNLPELIKAIGRIQPECEFMIQLIVAGQKQSDELDHLRVEWAGQGLSAPQLNCVGFVSEKELAALYEHVDFVVQPSLLEGFGLTALEAFAAGTPALVSGTGAAPEIVQDMSLMFDPNDLDDMARVISGAIAQRKKLKSQAESYKTRAKQFTWKRTGELALSALTAIETPKPMITLEAARTYTASKVSPLEYDGNAAASVLAANETKSSSVAKTRLFVDVTSTARVDHRTGIQRVVNNIVENIAEQLVEKDNVELVLVGTDDAYGFFPVELGKGSSGWDEHRADRIEFRRGDVILMLDSSWEFHAHHKACLQIARLHGAKVISTLYDMVPVRMPAFCGPGMPEVFSEWLRSALAISDGFVCISKAVADELGHFLKGISFPRELHIGYWPLGTNFIAPQEQSPSQRATFLSVGTLEPRKGHRIVLDAFDKVWADGRDADLCLVGRKGWGMEAFMERLLSHPEFGRRLTWRAGVNDAELARLYASSTALISASFAEGFGLPLIEAGYMGKPVIASDLPVFREVAGDLSAKFFDVGNSDALAERIIEELDAPSTVSTGSSDAADWAQSAERLLSLILDDEYQSHYSRQPDATTGKLVAISKSGVELLYTPEIIAASQSIRILVRIKNCSGNVWENGADGIDKGIHTQLAAMLAKPDGGWLREEPITVNLPLSLESEASMVLSLDVPLKDVRAGASTVYVAPHHPEKSLACPPVAIDLLSPDIVMNVSAAQLFTDAIG